MGDIRYALRNLLRRPTFTLIAVVTLALGIGANTAIFSAINALLLKPLPFPELNRVVAVWDKLPSRGVLHNEVTVANYLDWQSQTQSFDQLALYRWWSANLTGIDPPERIQGFLVTANFLDATGMKPIMGRNFTPEENQPGKDQVAIITHSLWQRRFGGDPNILNKTITINSVVRTVVGVMPERFNFPKGAEVYAPLAMTPELMKSRGNHSYYVIGRLKSGSSIQTAQAEIDNISARLEQQFPETNKGWGATVFPIVADTVRKKYDTGEKKANFFTEIQTRVSNLPGVETVGMITELPLSGQPNDLPYMVEGRPPVSPDQSLDADWRRINENYFSALHIPLLRGRNFTAQEVRKTEPVVIVSQSLVAAVFPNEDPLGKRLILALGDKRYEIIGVIGDIRHNALGAPPVPTMYLPWIETGNVNLVIRTNADPMSIVSGVRKEVLAVDPEQPLAGVKPMTALVEGSVSAQRYNTMLLGLFAVLAVVLAATGIYGVMSYTVAQRTHEIGVRMALGARRFDVLRLVLRQGMLLALAGVVLGLLGAFALTRVMAAFLFGVTARDPITFAVVSASLLVVAFVACLVPALRATKVDPLVALRYE